MFSLEFQRFVQLNHPPQNGKEPVCPHYNLIETCSLLAGVGINNRHFCGHSIKNEDTIGTTGPLSGFRGEVHIPHAACCSIHNILLMQLNIVEGNNNTQNKKLLTDPKTQKKYEERRASIIKGWRNVLLNIPDTNPDPNFSVIEPPEKPPSKEVAAWALENVRKYLSELEKITGSDEILLEARNCAQAPRHEENGILSLH